MKKDTSARLTLLLSVIAAALAFTAAAIEYSSRSDVNVGLIAGGLFLLVFGFAAKRRMSQ